jgi:hypothetical protein
MMKRIYGDFGDFEWFVSRKKQTQSKPIIYTGSNAKWIPAFAGMTDKNISVNRCELVLSEAERIRV